jgi:pyruvate,water dikinase
VTPLLHNRRARAAARRGSGAIDRQISSILRFLVERDPGLTARPGRFPFRPPLRFFLRALGQLAFAVLFPDRARTRVLARTEAWVRALEARADALGGLDRRQRFLAEVLPTFPPAVVGLGLPPLLGTGLGAVGLLQARLPAWLGDATALQPVLRALPHNPTTEMDLALWDVSRRLKQEGAAPSAGHPAVAAFLARYGHRAAREIDLGVPRWREDPTPILDVLRTYLTHGPTEDPARHFRRGAELAEQAVADLVERVRRRQGRLRAAWVRFLLRRVRALAGVREYPKFFAVRALAAMRRVLAGAGAELVAAGRLDHPEDVFFLDLRDLQAPHDLRGLAAANRQDYEDRTARARGRRKRSGRPALSRDHCPSRNHRSRFTDCPVSGGRLLPVLSDCWQGRWISLNWRR